MGRLTMLVPLAVLAVAVGCASGTGGTSVGSASSSAGSASSSATAAVTSVPPGTEGLTAGGQATVALLKNAAFTTIVQSCEVTITVTTNGAGGATTVATGTGVVDFHGHLGHLELVVDRLGAVNVIVSGQDVYLRFQRLGLLLGARPWFEGSYPLIGKVGASYNIGMLSSSPATDPSQGVGFLAGATGPVTVGGTQMVRGVLTTQYHVTIDPSLVATQAPAGSNAARVASLLGTTTFPIDLWIDALGRVRLVRYTVDLPDAPAEPATSPRHPVTAEVEYFGFGTPVDAVVPPDAQVRDLSALTGYLGRSAVP